MKMTALLRQTLLMLALIGLAAPRPGIAQTGDSDAATAALQKRVADLERSLLEVEAELKARSAPVPLVPVATPLVPVATAPIPVATTPAPPAADLAPVTAAADPSPQEEGHTLGPIQFRVFTDFNFGGPTFDNLPPGGLPGSTQSFGVGDFDLFVNSNIGEHMRVLSEVLVTSDFSNQFSAEIDRLMLTYKFNKYLSVTIGKFNTAIGFYTNEFHRARYFQTATSRPILFTDEDSGGILPVHSIGMSATGEIPSGALGLHWVAEVANGTGSQGSQTSNVEPVQNFVDENNGKATNFALYARPEAVSGLQVGGSFYRDTLHPAGLSSFEEHIFSAYAALVRPRLELLAESVLLQHQSLSDGMTFNTTSSYAQASYKMGFLRPYLRYEYQNVPSGDPISGILGRENGPSAGVRFDLNDFSCLKLQYGRLATRTGLPANDIQAQIAIVF
ncbi:MAG: hypothetical protein ABSG03_28980 [Bryobacteraceae bacterium]|jgi:hypothetical protein